MVRVWRERGFADRPRTRLPSSRPRWPTSSRPTWPRPGCSVWVGNEDLHLSHRSNLRPRTPSSTGRGFVERFGPSPTTALPLAGARRLARAAEPEGVRTWVVRLGPPQRAGACLMAGVVGLGTQSGSTSTRPACRLSSAGAVEGALGRRPAKEPGQLSSFLDAMKSGTRGPPIKHGAGLLLGEIVGDYLSRGASCCRTGGRPGGTGWCRGRPPARPRPCRDPVRCSPSSSTPMCSAGV